MAKTLVGDFDLSRPDNGLHFTFVRDVLKKARAVTAAVGDGGQAPKLSARSLHLCLGS